MSDRPRITVAVPTMNGSRHLAEALRSVLAQDGVLFDLLLSDDRSTDDTLDRARDVAGDRVRVVVNSERLGLAGNWNQCVRLSRTPFVAVVHQDDLLRPGHLAAHLRAFGSNPEVGLVASASTVIDESGNEVPASVIERGGLGPTDRTFAAGESLRKLAAGNPLRCTAVTIRAEAHADVGGFNPTYRYVVDWDFWLRVARRWSLAWRGAPTVAIRWHSASETHRFKTGVADLEETECVVKAVLNDLGSKVVTDAERVDAEGVAASAFRKLSRAYLNRAHVTLRAGNGPLARGCLVRSLRYWPGVVWLIAADPRLAAQMAAVCVAPGPTGRWLGRTV